MTYYLSAKNGGLSCLIIFGSQNIIHFFMIHDMVHEENVEVEKFYIVLLSSLHEYGIMMCRDYVGHPINVPIFCGILNILIDSKYRCLNQA